MTKSTKLMIAADMKITTMRDQPTAKIDGPVGDINHLRSTVDFSDAQTVRRVTVRRDASGNISLELEE